MVGKVYLHRTRVSIGHKVQFCGALIQPIFFYSTSLKITSVGISQKFNIKNIYRDIFMRKISSGFVVKSSSVCHGCVTLSWTEGRIYLSRMKGNGEERLIQMFTHCHLRQHNPSLRSVCVHVCVCGYYFYQLYWGCHRRTTVSMHVFTASHV